MGEENMLRILFVCLGNICRSPAAQAVFEKLLVQHQLTGQIEVDSAGILDYHEGEEADPRMRNAARKRGYTITHRSRPITPEDFSQFDHIIAMDRKVLQSLEELESSLTAQEKKRKRAMLSLFLEHTDRSPKEYDVPDPYWSGPEGFEHVMDLIEEGCYALLDNLTNNCIS